MSAADRQQSGQPVTAPVKKVAVLVLRWQVDVEKQSAFRNTMSGVLKELKRFGFSAVLMQPVVLSGDPVWELRIQAGDFVSLAKLLDGRFVSKESSPLGSILGGSEGYHSAGAELFRGWIPDDVPSASSG